MQTLEKTLEFVDTLTANERSELYAALKEQEKRDLRQRARGVATLLYQYLHELNMDDEKKQVWDIYSKVYD